MAETTRVDFHCHSTASDGFYSPEQVVVRLDGAHVRYAALTDHDTTAGLRAFAGACARRGVSFVTGVELSVGDDRDFLHLLAYGFDPEDPALQALMARTRARRAGHRPEGTATMAELHAFVRDAFEADQAEGRSWLDALAETIAVVHGAHGRAFLAHPLSLSSDPEELDELLAMAKGVGLDGVEALYARHSDVEKRTLTELARKHGLLVCAGSDYHGPQRTGPLKPGADMPTDAWKAFRDAVIASPAATRALRDARQGPNGGPRPRARDFVLRILWPALLAIALFVAGIFVYIVPAFERQLVERKRELIRELTSSAWSVLADYEAQERAGTLTRAQAQAAAAERVGAMRYGGGRKDYFWITDMHPRMIMHPYRGDLVGQDLTTFADPNGVRLFVEFVERVTKDHEGYLQYVWQWKDDPERLAPKESYVRGFAPWSWIIGTGIYVADVRREIDHLVSRVVDVSAVISAVIVLLLLYIIQTSLRIERRRRRAVRELDESHEKYRALVEAATEGTIMVLDGSVTFANTTAQDMLGYTTEEFALLDIWDVLPRLEGEEATARVEALLQGDDDPTGFEARLRRKDGRLREAVLTASRISFAGRQGFILNARDVSGHKQVEEALDQTREKYHALTERLDIGVFRAEASESGCFVELNPAARRIFGVAPDEDPGARVFLDAFADPDEGANLLRTLREEEVVTRHVVTLTRPDGKHPIASLSVALSRSLDQGRRVCDGIVDDITARKRADAERDSLIAELQTSLLFLNEPIRHFAGRVLSCAPHDAIADVAARLTREQASAMLVRGEADAWLGIVTDHDFRERVLVEQRDPGGPVYEIMSAPLVAMPQRALVYEAILLMRERNIRNLAVRDEAGRVVGLLRHKDLMRFERYSAAVLAREIQHTRSVDEIAQSQRRLPLLVKGLIDSGTHTRSVTRIITTVSDTIVERLVALALERLGPPPARFAFMALGSEGRGEQTLVTDQDNALVFEDPPDPETGASWKAWFERLGALVCDDLDRAGYAFCKGDLMARNPRWCQPLGKWKRTFEQWIATASPEDMLEINKFFDFRAACGERALLDDLAAHLKEVLRARSPFFAHFAANALLRKPPLGVFGQIVAGGRSRPGTVDLKVPMMLIVSFARLYALHRGVSETNTVDRLHRLHELGVTAATAHREILHAYDTLMRMRLAHQARAISQDEAPDNAVALKRLTLIEESTLKQIFTQIAGMQTMIARDFRVEG